MAPLYVRSSTCSVMCAPGKHLTTLRGSLRNAHTLSTGSDTSNFFSIVTAMIYLPVFPFRFKDKDILPARLRGIRNQLCDTLPGRGCLLDAVRCFCPARGIE